MKNKIITLFYIIPYNSLIHTYSIMESQSTKLTKNLSNTNDNLKSFIKLVESENSSHPNYINFINLCNSLNPQNKTHNDINNIIMDYIVIQDLPINEKLSMIFLDIYNNNLVDFTIKFPNKITLRCLKVIFKTIPYFGMVFQDINIGDSIELTNYKTTSILIKLLYVPDSKQITVTNYVNLFVLMDKYLMINYFGMMIEFGMANIESIINYLLNKKNLNSIQKLIKILYNVHAEYSRQNSENTAKDVMDIINRIFDVHFGENIIMFKNWPAIFSNDNKINAIKKSKHYELLNVADINPNKVLSLLAEIDISNNVFNQLYSILLKLPGYFGEKISELPTERSVIITNYYPILKYISIYSTSIKIIETYENSIVITFTKSPSINISIGSIVTFDIGVVNSYSIEKIIRNYNDEQTEINEIIYDLPIPFWMISELKDITYHIYLDKSLIEKDVDNMWALEYIDHKIKHL